MQIFSRSIFVGILVGVLILGLSGGLVLGKKQSGTPGNVSVTEKTKAQWKFDSSQCGVAIDVHSNANLQRQNLVPGGSLIWSNNFDDSQLMVKTESNCYNGYTVSVYVSNTQPSPDTVDVLADFWLATEKGITNADSSNVTITLPNQNDWNQFSDTGSGNDLSLGEVDESDLDNNLNNVDGTEWIMDYKYEMDDNDIPNQEYFVELTYVVASQ